MTQSMTLQEKSLYSQIHPLRLLAEWLSTFIALALVWQNNLLAAIVVAIVPQAIVSAYVLQRADLQGIKESRLGDYVRKYATRSSEYVRALGAALMLLAAWFHLIWLLPFGLFIVVLGWANGLIFRGRAKPEA